MVKNEILQEGSATFAQNDEIDSTPRLLVVDDDPDIRRFNTEILIAAGYEVESAPDGAVAWEMIQQQPFTLLLTDNDMPKVSGLELIKNLQEAGILLPVILITGSPPPPESIHSAQIKAVLLKPYTADELLMKTRNVLQVMKANVQSDLPFPVSSSQPVRGVRL